MVGQSAPPSLLLLRWLSACNLCRLYLMRFSFNQLLIITVLKVSFIWFCAFEIAFAFYRWCFESSWTYVGVLHWKWIPTLVTCHRLELFTNVKPRSLINICQSWWEPTTTSIFNVNRFYPENEESIKKFILVFFYRSNNKTQYIQSQTTVCNRCLWLDVLFFVLKFLPYSLASPVRL